MIFQEFNLYLFSLFLIYFISLGIGFSIKSKSKDNLNKSYQKYKKLLHLFLLFIFTLTLILFFVIALSYNFYILVLTIHILFMLYLFRGISKNTRCWKQHRLIYYNFILIFLLYITLLLIPNFELLILILFGFICIYTVLEFQYAKFSIKQILMWD